MAYQATTNYKRSGKLTFKTSNASDAPNITRTYSALNVNEENEATSIGVPFETFAALMLNMYTKLSIAILPSQQTITYVREQPFINAT